MATTFTGLRVQDTYNAILKIGNNSNLSGTAKILSDGVGNSSSIYLSTTRLGIGITPAYQFHTSGNAKIGGNLIVSGNLTVNGTLTYLNVEDLAVEDPLIKLAKDNTANTLDIGFFGKYVATGTKYKGLFNDASDDKFKLFIGTGTEPTTTVDTTASGYAVGTLVANLEGNVTGTVSSLSNHDTNDLSEGSTNLYYTNARADARVNLQTGANLDLSSKDTDDLSEGTTNLYFTTTRARASFTDGTGVTITDGEIAIGQAVATDSNVNFNRITSSEDIRFDGTNTRLRSDSEFDFLTISGQAQSLRTKGVSAQTTYSGNSASSGMFNALNGYAVGTGSGTTVIDSSRNLTNIGTATFAGSVTGTQAIFSSSTAPVIQSTSSSTAENMLLVGTDTTAASAPDLVLYRNAGATADNDTLGVVEFRGRNDANTGVKSYSGIYSRIIDASENKGALTFSANSGSNYVNVLAIHNTGTNQPKVIIGNTDPFAVPTHTLDVDGTLHVSGSISGTTGTFSGNISALGGSFTDPVTIYDSTISENPRLSLGRQAAESLQFDVTDRVAVIRHKNDSDSNQVHSLDFTIDTPSTGDKTFNFGVAGNTTSTYLTISNTGATFTGLVTGIAPTSDLNFATKKIC